MTSKLKSYTFVYLVTTDIGGQTQVLYTEASPASVLISFDEFKTPPEAGIINVMVLVYKSNGQLEDYGSKLSTAQTIAFDLTTLPTNLLTKLVKKLED